jgi:hypothetical protein
VRHQPLARVAEEHGRAAAVPARYACAVGVRGWIRRVFPFVGPDDESAEGEELRGPDRGAAAVERERDMTPYASAEGSDAARDELDSFRPPPDPDP